MAETHFQKIICLFFSRKKEPILHKNGKALDTWLNDLI